MTSALRLSTGIAQLIVMKSSSSARPGTSVRSIGTGGSWVIPDETVRALLHSAAPWLLYVRAFKTYETSVRRSPMTS